MKTRKEIMEELVAEKAKSVVVTDEKKEVSEKSKNLQSAFYKALVNKDAQALANMQGDIEAGYKALGDGQNVTTPADGGYLVPVELNNSIIEKLTYISPIRKIATVIANMPAKLEIPAEDAMVRTYWVKEGSAPTAGKETFSKTILEPHKLGAFVKFSYESLNDTAVNPSLQNFVASRVAKAIAMEENGAFVNGDGSGKPFGFRSSKITPKTGAVKVPGTLTYEDIVNAVYGIHPESRANGVFACSTKTLARIVALTDKNGAPIFHPAIAQGAPATMLGYAIYEVPEITDDELWFGDFKNYIIGDRGALRINFGTTGTDFENDVISLVAFKRVAGIPTLGDSFFKLTGIEGA